MEQAPKLNRKELADKLKDIRNSDPENPKAGREKAQGYLEAKQETPDDTSKIRARTLDELKIQSGLNGEVFDELARTIKFVALETSPARFMSGGDIGFDFSFSVDGREVKGTRRSSGTDWMSIEGEPIDNDTFRMLDSKYTKVVDHLLLISKKKA